MCTFGVLGLSCFTHPNFSSILCPRAAGTCTSAKTPSKFHKKTFRERKRTKMEAGEGKKARNFGPLNLQDPTLRGAPPFGPLVHFFCSVCHFLVFPNAVFSVPFVFFCPECICSFCPDGRLLLLSCFRFFAPTPVHVATSCSLSVFLGAAHMVGQLDCDEVMGRLYMGGWYGSMEGVLKVQRDHQESGTDGLFTLSDKSDWASQR